MTAPAGESLQKFFPPLRHRTPLDFIVGKSAGNKIIMGDFLTPGTVVTPVTAHTAPLAGIVRLVAGDTDALPGGKGVIRERDRK
jgi:hypothetical protein